MLCALVLTLVAEWGADLEPGVGPRLIEMARQDLDRAFNKPETFIEALKRFREPELKGAFLALLEHDNWRIRHRALLALAGYGDPDAIKPAWALLEHPNARLREMAAITCLRLWTPDTEAPGKLDPDAERDFHVRQCLLALCARTAVRRVYAEPAGGWIPFVTEPGLPQGSVGTTKPQRPDPPRRWCHPLLGWGQEEVPDAGLRGACLDGAGIYAVTEGVVRAVVRGAKGTSVVVLHKDAISTYSHAGSVVFVAEGQRVACGQLLATLGMGYSAENGGVPAQLGFTLDRGEKFLDLWVAWTTPLVDGLPPMDLPARALLDKGQYAAAHAAAAKVRESEEPGSEAYVDAALIVSKLEELPNAAVRRAEAMRDAGYPAAALALLRDLVARCGKLPGAEALAEAAKALKKDHGKALRGDARIEITRQRVAKLKPDRARAAWEALLKQYADTVLAARIKGELDR
ncbi:MAG: HEAT repeat domain-containing protein [Planctomycetota bacterium]